MTEVIAPSEVLKDTPAVETPAPEAKPEVQEVRTEETIGDVFNKTQKEDSVPLSTH